MKITCALWLVLLSTKLYSQRPLEAYPVKITTGKTTNIIFPSPIVSVDRGIGAVLVQKARNVDNILQLKADSANFNPTNLTVITLGGAFYSFSISYTKEPDTLNISFENEKAIKQKSFLHKGITSEELKLTLKSIYIIDHKLVFRFKLTNFSQIDYDPTVRFYIKDEKQSKRTAIQETAINPILPVNIPIIKGNKKDYFEASFREFTIPKNKRFICELSDENDQRELILQIKHKTILKARTAK